MLTFVNDIPRESLYEVLDEGMLANIVGPDATPNDLYEQYNTPNPHRYFILSNGVLAGELTFRALSSYKWDIGFWVHPDYHGQRLIDQAWESVIHNFEDQILTASCWENNIHATNLLGRLGFRLVENKPTRTGVTSSFRQVG